MEQYTEDDWETNRTPVTVNHVLDCGDWYVSYNPNPPLSPCHPETAICIDGRYYILAGDRRDELTPLAHSREELLRFFRKHQDEATARSEYPSTRGGGNDAMSEHGMPVREEMSEVQREMRKDDAS